MSELDDLKSDRQPVLVSGADLDAEIERMIRLATAVTEDIAKAQFGSATDRSEISPRVVIVESTYLERVNADTRRDSS